jgi:broad specificity phosphatase PhoE
MKIIFIRHGETNAKTGTLSLKGKLQSMFARQYLKNEKVDEIFVSPQTRALQTANILNKKFNVPLNILKEFDERDTLKMGQIAGYKNEFTKNYLNYDFESEEYETCKKFVERVFSGLNKIVEKNLNCVVIVGHSSSLYAINAFVCGIPKDKKIKWLQCNNGAVIKFFVE